MKRSKEFKALKLIISGTLYVLYFYYLAIFISKSTIDHKIFYAIVGICIGICGLYYEIIKLMFHESIEYITEKDDPQTGIEKLTKLSKYDFFRDYSYYSDMYALVALSDMGEYDEIKRLAKRTLKGDKKNAMNDAISELGYMIVYGRDGEAKKSHDAYKKFKLLYESNIKDFKKLDGIFMRCFQYYEALDSYYQGKCRNAIELLDTIETKKLSKREIANIESLRSLCTEANNK